MGRSQQKWEEPAGPQRFPCRPPTALVRVSLVLLGQVQLRRKDRCPAGGPLQPPILPSPPPHPQAFQQVYVLLLSLSQPSILLPGHMWWGWPPSPVQTQSQGLWVSSVVSHALLIPHPTPMAAGHTPVGPLSCCQPRKRSWVLICGPHMALATWAWDVVHAYGLVFRKTRVGGR